MSAGRVPDIACGNYLGDTSCILPWKHDGDHQAADAVTVDRNLQPLNRCRVRRVGRRESMFANAAEYKGKASVSLTHDSAEGEGRGGVSSQPVNRPAVRIGDRWVRRCPDLEVVAA